MPRHFLHPFCLNRDVRDERTEKKNEKEKTLNIQTHWRERTECNKF